MLHPARAHPGDPTDPLADCTRTVLNCSAAAQQRQLAAYGRPLVIPLDPSNPLGSPVVSCAAPATAAAAGAAAQQPQQQLVVVFHGAHCPLWRPTASGCFWNATAASFEGAGCVAAPALDCVCSGSGLSDFRALTTGAAAAGAPAAASISQLPAVPPRSAWASTWAVAAVVIALTAAAPLAAGALGALERRARTRALRELTRALGAASCGFRQLTSGDWCYSVQPPSITGGGSMVAGELVNIAAACSLPLIRLRLAIPEELLAPGDLLRVAGFTCAACPKNVATGSLFAPPRRVPSGSFRNRRPPRSRIEMVIGAVRSMEQAERLKERARKQREEARAAAEARRKAAPPRRDSSGRTALDSALSFPRGDDGSHYRRHGQDGSSGGGQHRYGRPAPLIGVLPSAPRKARTAADPTAASGGTAGAPPMLPSPPDVEEELLLVTPAATMSGGVGVGGEPGVAAEKRSPRRGGSRRLAAPDAGGAGGESDDDAESGEDAREVVDQDDLAYVQPVCTELLGGEAGLSDSPWLVGTALATAALYRGRLLPTSELALRQMRLAEVFAAVTTCVPAVLLIQSVFLLPRECVKPGTAAAAPPFEL